MIRTIASALCLAFLQLAPATAAAPASQRIFLYTTGGDGEWCAVDTLTEARKISAVDRYATGTSAVADYRNGQLASVVLTTQSEDAFAEDSYRFDRAWNISAMIRRGRYAIDPVFSVTYAPSPSGKLILTQQSRIAAKRHAAAGRETYFLDWDRYTRFAQFPFAKILDPRKAMVTRRCRI